MCWHNYEYQGWVNVKRWLYGVAGGILVDDCIEAKQCTKCGKLKEIR